MTLKETALLILAPLLLSETFGKEPEQQPPANYAALMAETERMESGGYRRPSLTMWLEISPRRQGLIAHFDPIEKDADHLPTVKVYVLESGNLLEIAQKSNFFVDVDPLTGSDINRDGHKEIVILQRTGGNCTECTWGSILNISDTRAIELLDRAYNPQIVDLDHDGDFEVISRIKAILESSPFATASRPLGLIVIAWDGRTYRDMSSHYPEFFEGEINELKRQLASFEHGDGSFADDERFASNAISLLYRYYALGDCATGWATYRQYLADHRFSSSYWQEEQERLTKRLEEQLRCPSDRP